MSVIYLGGQIPKGSAITALSIVAHRASRSLAFRSLGGSDNNTFTWIGPRGAADWTEARAVSAAWEGLTSASRPRLDINAYAGRQGATNPKLTR
jgi:hypothetical protein